VRTDGEQGEITLLIEQTRPGDTDAQLRLFHLVYEELIRIAHRQQQAGRDGETMQPTVLANEAYLLLMRNIPAPPQGEKENRRTFFRTAALAMRAILRDYWRRKNASKRGGEQPPVALGDLDAVAPQGRDRVDFLALDAALNELESYNRRWYDVVMHRYFGGRTIEETAELLGIAPATVKSDWSFARAWLRRALDGECA